MDVFGEACPAPQSTLLVFIAVHHPIIRVPRSSLHLSAGGHWGGLLFGALPRKAARTPTQQPLGGCVSWALPRRRLAGLPGAGVVTLRRSPPALVPRRAPAGCAGAPAGPRPHQRSRGQQSSFQPRGRCSVESPCGFHLRFPNDCELGHLFTCSLAICASSL